MEVLGIDIGGSGIKGAIVDVATGELVTERHRIPTPSPSTPDNMADAVNELISTFSWSGEIGCSFPSVIIDGKAMTAGNISDDWIGINVEEIFKEHCNGLTFHVGNDADLAGVAEMQFGAGQELLGKVIMITIGTGIGSGLFYNSELVPNLELGHIFHTDGRPIELWASDSARKRDEIELHEWADRFNFFLSHVIRTFSPDHFILGGGISKKYHQFRDHLTVETPIYVAQSRNHAGIIGAAVYAHSKNES